MTHTTIITIKYLDIDFKEEIREHTHTHTKK